MPLQNFIAKNLPAISAAWLNTVDVLKFTIFGDATTKAQARTSLTSDLPLEIVNGGTAARTAAAARASLTSDEPLEIGNGGTGFRDATSPSLILDFISLFFPSIYALINPVTPQEAAKSVTPTNYRYLFGDLRRYGAVGGIFGAIPATDDSVAWATAVAVGYVIVPAGMAFKIVTGTTCAGQLTVVGFGKLSQLYSDTTLVTVSNGSGSTFDNVWLGNITPPWIITRDPTNWAADVSGTLQQSSVVLGYQPTVNDNDIWPILTTAQQNQQIGPTISFIGIASDITVSRIYGQFVLVNIQDAQFSQIRNCDIRGGKGVWGGLLFDNATNNLQMGIGNSAIGNTVRYASFSGINFMNNSRPTINGNNSSLNGESGVKAASFGNVLICTLCSINGNTVSDNFYDGLDLVTSFPTNTTVPAFNQITGNVMYRNGGDGVNIDGQYSLFDSNYVISNGRYGVWCTGARTKISNNFVYQNNTSQGPNHDILGGLGDGCTITGNYVDQAPAGGASAIFYTANGTVLDNYAVGGPIFVGNPTFVNSVADGNIDSISGALTPQSFCFDLQNNGGTLQHVVYSDSSSTGPGQYSRVLGATPGGFVTTPIGPDSTTAFAAGAKIGSAATNALWLNTAPQVSLNVLMVAQIVLNSTGTVLNVQPMFLSTNINGVVQYRLVFEFTDAASGAPFALNSSTIASGKSIRVQFYGKLA